MYVPIILPIDGPFQFCFHKSGIDRVFPVQNQGMKNLIRIQTLSNQQIINTKLSQTFVMSILLKLQIVNISIKNESNLDTSLSIEYTMLQICDMCLDIYKTISSYVKLKLYFEYLFANN